MPTRSREIRLAARPRGAPVASDFELAEVELPDPADGQILVRNAFVSVDPYMRGRMNDAKSYVPPFALGEPMRGGAVGVVVASRDDRWPEGTWVQHDLGWREAAVLDGRGIRAVNPELAPVSTRRSASPSTTGSSTCSTTFRISKRSRSTDPRRPPSGVGWWGRRLGT